MYHKPINHEEVATFLQRMKETEPGTKIYIGTDSVRRKVQGKWYADYTLVICVHIGSCHGCKIFAEMQTERDFDTIPGRPFSRMMTEARKATELYDRFKDVFDGFEVSIHLDINPKESEGSNVAAQAALGFVKGVTNIVPILKPLGLAASFGADRAQDLGLAA